MRFSFFLFILLSFKGVNAQDYSKFPSDTYWVNCGFNIAPESFKDKMCVVVFWDMHDPIALYNVHRFQRLAKQFPQLQLVSIVKGDVNHKIPLSELTAYVQDHNINHPFGVSANFSPFVEQTAKASFHAYYFNKSTHPELMAAGPVECENIAKQIDEFFSIRENLKGYGAWQMTSDIDPKFYADPLLELPGDAAINEAQNTFFVVENAQHRVVHYDSDGTLLDLIGGIEAGDKDGNLRSARFSMVTGITYDAFTRQAFVADLGAQRVKAIDVESGLVYSFLGIGSASNDIVSKIEGNGTQISYPLDVQSHQRSLYILMGSPAQLVKVNATTAALESNAILETRLDPAAGQPIRISKGDKGILVLTLNGYVYQINYEGDVLTPTLRWKPNRWEDVPSDVIERKGQLIFLMTRRHSIVSYQKGKEKLIAGSGEKGFMNGKEANLVQFNLPSSMVATGSRILVSDRGNHLMRLVTLDKKKLNVRSIAPKYTFEFFTVGDALNVGEPVYFESEVFGVGQNEVFLRWDLGDYEMVKEGRNELVSDLAPGIFIGENAVSEDGLRFAVDTEQAQEFAQIELYLTLRLKSNPDVIVLKKAGLNLSFSPIPGEALSHEFDYLPRLLP